MTTTTLADNPYNLPMRGECTLAAVAMFVEDLGMCCNVDNRTWAAVWATLALAFEVPAQRQRVTELAMQCVATFKRLQAQGEA